MELSPNKERYVINLDHAAALDGLLFFSLKNSLGSWVIPTTKNFIGGYQIKKIKCDDGATCSVFPVEDTDMLRDIFERYAGACSFSLIPLKSVGGIILGLVVQEKLNRKIFDVHIGTDIFPFVKVARNLDSELQQVASSAVAGPISIENVNNFLPIASVPLMSFFLCSEDILFLLDPVNSALRDFLKVGAGLLVPYAQNIKRRSSALLGSDFLGVVGEGGVAYGKAKYYFNPQVHRLELCTWPMMSDITLSIRDMKYLKTGSIDFHVMDSIEPNDIIGFVADEDEINPYDDPNVEL